MKVLVADRLVEESLDEMRTLGVAVDYQPDIPPEDLPAALHGVNVLVVRGTEVSKRALEAGESLNLIIRAGAGTTNIDVRTASDRGVYVAICPGKNASAVAELTLTLIGSLDRRVPDAVASLRAGKWEKEEFAKARGLRGRRIGIAGLGHVGREVLRLAHAYGMEAVAYSRSLTSSRASELGVARASSLEDLARRVDVFTVHLDLNERTRGSVDRRVFEALPDEAMFINTARSEVVDYDALLQAIPKKRLRVGLDVFPEEPLKRNGNFEHPIFRSGLVYATPHIGASTDEAQTAIANETVRILRSFITKGEVPNVVNIAQTTWCRYQLVVRHLDKVGSLANVLNVIKRHGINVQELDNTVFEGGKAACAKMRLDTRPSDACLQEIMAFDDEVLHVDLVTLPNLA
jgi:D-3-phosphoglycerate dehydrogenase